MGKINMPVMFATADDIGAAKKDHKHSADDINTGTLEVARGGTGTNKFVSGEVLIGADTGAVTTRAITDLTEKGLLQSTVNLVTARTVVNHAYHRFNRNTAVNLGDTNYTTYMARGIALVNAVPTSMVNGTVAFVLK